MGLLTVQFRLEFTQRPHNIQTQKIRVRAVSHVAKLTLDYKLGDGGGVNVQSVFIAIYSTTTNKGKHIHSREFFTPDLLLRI